MSVSAVAPTPFYQDPDRLPIGLPQASADTKAEPAKNGDGKRLSMFAAGDDEPSFWDVLDIINPLQHIPVISNLYREMTGDQIGVGARLMGGTLFGGPIGLIASAVDCVVEESTGQDTGAHMLALFRDEGESSPTTTTTQFAQAQGQGQAQGQAASPAEPPLPAAAPQPPVTAEAVSSSPAKAVAGGKDGAAPVITLPDAGAPAVAGGAPQPMVFSLGDMQAAAPAAPASPQAAPVAATAAQAAAAKPMPLIAGGRAMPTPTRNANANPAPMPSLNVPVSNSGMRSNTPITGRSPTANANVMAAQERMGSHPMLPPTDANGQTAAGPDWFTAAWGQALDKYQRTNQRNDKAAAPAATSTLQ